LVRQLVTESLLLAGAGGIAGFVLAKLAIGIVAAYQPPLPFTISFDLSVDARVLLFTMMVSLATGVVFGLAPALHASRPDLVPALKASSAREAAGRRRFGLRSILAAAQMSLAMVLMVGAALLSRSIWAARSLDLGFRPERLALVSVEMGMHGYSEAAGKAFFRDALERVRAAPGVRSAAWAWNAPFSANNMSHEFLIEGRSYPPDSPGESIAVAYLSPGYFATLETPLLEGRDFTEADRETTPGAAIVSEALARKYWPGESAIGKRIRRARRDESLEVIGVSGDYKVRTLGERPRPVVHLALSQRYSPAATLVARGDGSESPLVETIRGKMLELDPNLALFEAKTMREQMALPLFPVRAAAALISGAGLFALLLAAIGIYGVIAHSVGQRRREVGLRMALGAERGNVVKMVLGEGMAIAAAGMVVGLAAAALAGRILGAVLYQVSALDPTAFASASLVMLGVALLANYLPARRAAGANPVVALRHD
jgi:predicted permease